MPADVFREKRAEILRGFVARRALFSTPQFPESHEAVARANLAAAISDLA